MNTRLISIKDIANKDLFVQIQHTVICFICSGILLNPVQCITCGNCFCSECAQSWQHNQTIIKCPFKCPSFNLIPASKFDHILLSKIIFIGNKSYEQKVAEIIKQNPFPSNIGLITRKKITYKNGSIYEGSYSNGTMNGIGVFIWPNGQKYEGDFKQGTITGIGKMIYANGSVYIGEFLKENKEGYGTYNMVSKQKYEGFYKDGVMDGKGKLMYANGDIYDGDWIKDKKEGYGIYQWKNGNKYEGMFKNGLINGKGIMTYIDGRSYDGHWCNEIKDGYGILIQVDGSKYEGYFKQNKKNGKGTFFDNSFNQTITGEWLNDRKIN